MLSQLGATALVPVTIGDDASNLEERFGRWTAQVLSLLSTTSASAASTTSGEEVSKRQAKKKARSQEVSLKKKNEAQDQYSGTTKYPVKPVKGSTKSVTSVGSTSTTATVSIKAADKGCCGGGGSNEGASKTEGCCSTNTTSATKSSGCGCNETADANTLGEYDSSFNFTC